jgi:hypothetical protein
LRKNKVFGKIFPKRFGGSKRSKPRLGRSWKTKLLLRRTSGRKARRSFVFNEIYAQTKIPYKFHIMTVIPIYIHHLEPKSFYCFLKKRKRKKHYAAVESRYMERLKQKFISF